MQHYGERNGDDWIVSHSIDLKNEYRLLGQKELATRLGEQGGYASHVGVKFVVTLDRELPDPIVPIELPESSVD